MTLDHMDIKKAQTAFPKLHKQAKSMSEKRNVNR